MLLIITHVIFLHVRDPAMASEQFEAPKKLINKVTDLAVWSKSEVSYIAHQLLRLVIRVYDISSPTSV